MTVRPKRNKVSWKNGYSAIANELIMAVCAAGFDGTEMAILLSLIRHTYGDRRRDRCGYSIGKAVIEIPQSSRSTIGRAFSKLVAQDVITCFLKQSGKRLGEYGVNPEYQTWSRSVSPWWDAKESPSVSPKRDAKESPSVSPKRDAKDALNGTLDSPDGTLPCHSYGTPNVPDGTPSSPDGTPTISKGLPQRDPRGGLNNMKQDLNKNNRAAAACLGDFRSDAIKLLSATFVNVSSSTMQNVPRIFEELSQANSPAELWEDFEKAVLETKESWVRGADTNGKRIFDGSAVALAKWKTFVGLRRARSELPTSREPTPVYTQLLPDHEEWWNS